MKKIIITIALSIVTFISAQSQQVPTGGQYEQGMGKAFGLWKEGKSNEASAVFATKDKESINALLLKAQNALDLEIAKDQSNAELYVMQAMINTAWIVYDPMTNGQKLSGPTMGLYAKAEALAPNNPRVVFSKAEFEIGSASFWGKDTKPMCAQIDKAIALFATFKPETVFAPNWGLDRAVEAQKKCK